MTPIFKASTEWGKAIDTEEGKIKQLMELGLQTLQPLIGRLRMKSCEIAAIVKGIIVGKNTSFCCFTNVGFSDEEIAAR